MNYLHKLLLVALTAVPFLVGAAEESEDSVKYADLGLPAKARLATVADTNAIKDITYCQYLTPNVVLLAEQLGVAARIESLGLSGMAQEWELSTIAERLRLPTLAQWLCLPAIAKSIGFFKEEAPAENRRIWIPTLLEQLTVKQLLQLNKTQEIGLDELLLVLSRKVLLPKQKTD